jgi:2-dehydro-3-deoxyphosphogluconate aldolase/(4S)-4-hydroxy-2-oxoglutarate aldolase
VLEITMTVPGAIRVIEEVARRFGDDVVVGAGTVLDSETARACILAGAQFIVSPSLDLDTISLCRRYSVTVMPGAMTPSEVVTAWKAGADFVKMETSHQPTKG